MDDIEKKHVYDVYQDIATHFEATRKGYTWKSITNFINSLDKNSILADVGTGSGRNIIRDDLYYHVSDLCPNFCKMIENKKLSNCNVECCNILKLPYQNNSMDNVICIAVIHHLTTKEKRLKACQELIRILKPNGKLFIQVWAQNESDDLSKDELVKWTKHNGEKLYRFYHKFSENELYNIFSDIEEIKILEYFNERNNWVLILEKQDLPFY